MNNDVQYNGYDTIGRKLADGKCIDGCWTLPVFVEGMDGEVTVRMRGDRSLGDLIYQVTSCATVKLDWSDYAIWRRDVKVWLLRNKTSLDQYNIQSDAKLSFRRMHNDLQVMLPSLTTVTLRVSFADKVFGVVKSICKELNIRHHEELSLTLPMTKSHLKANLPLPSIQGSMCGRTQGQTENTAFKARLNNTNTLNSKRKVGNISPSNYGTMQSNISTMPRSKDSVDRCHVRAYDDICSRRSAKDVFGGDWLMKPKNFIQRARLNSGWLDSSRSLLEHDIEPVNDGDSPPLLYMYFKYYTFYDLNVKYDGVRIHQLYEQARWSILSGQLECTEDEMIVFATYQLQAESQAPTTNPMLFPGSPSIDGYSPNYQTLGAYTTLDSTGRHLTTPRGNSMTTVRNPNLLRHQQSLSNASPNFGTLDRTITQFGDASPVFGASLIDGHSNARPKYHNVDDLLSELEQSCGVDDKPGTMSRALQQQSHSINPTLPSRSVDVPDTAEIPSLLDNIRVLHSGGGSINPFRYYKLYWATIRENRFYLFKNRDDVQTAQPMYEYTLFDCYPTPNISIRNQTYGIKLSISTETHSPQQGANGSSTPFAISTNKNQLVMRQDLLLKLKTVEQYARWLAAFRLGSKRKTLASRVMYEREVETIMEMIQVAGTKPVKPASEANMYLAHLRDFCSERIISKAKSKNDLCQRISEALGWVQNLSSTEAEYKYILAWQRLINFGRSYFIVSLDKTFGVGALYDKSSGVGGLFSKSTDDMFVVYPGRIGIVSPQSGEVIHAWDLSDLRSWNINWDSGKVMLDLRSGPLSFRPLSSNCKTVCEFIGGYIFLLDRTLDKNQDCNESKFHQLTGNTKN